MRSGSALRISRTARPPVSATSCWVGVGCSQPGPMCSWSMRVHRSATWEGNGACAKECSLQRLPGAYANQSCGRGPGGSREHLPSCCLSYRLQRCAVQAPLLLSQLFAQSPPVVSRTSHTWSHRWRTRMEPNQRWTTALPTELARHRAHQKQICNPRESSFGSIWESSISSVSLPTGWLRGACFLAIPSASQMLYESVLILFN